jgi:TRAP-type C4-dicarboxylate transport system substrate-binding protein
LLEKKKQTMKKKRRFSMSLKKVGYGVGIGVMLLSLSLGFPAPAPAQQAPEFKFDIASVLDSQHPIVLGGNMWGKIVAEKTKGRVQVNVYPNSQLGGNRETAQATQNGLIQVPGFQHLTSSFVSQRLFDLPTWRRTRIRF